MIDFIKLSENAHTDPKLLAVGCEGFTLYVKGLTYSKSELLDGFIPEEAMPIIGIGIKDPAKTAKLLIDRDLWDRAEGGYAVKPERWARWQQTKEEVEAQREFWREKRRSSGQGNRRGVPRVSQGTTRGTVRGTLRGQEGGVPRMSLIKEKEEEKEFLNHNPHEGKENSGPWRHRIDGRWGVLGDRLASGGVVDAIEAFEAHRMEQGQGGLTGEIFETFARAVVDRSPTEAQLVGFLREAVRSRMQTPNVTAFHRWMEGTYVPKGGRQSASQKSREKSPAVEPEPAKPELTGAELLLASVPASGGRRGA